MQNITYNASHLAPTIVAALFVLASCAEPSPVGTSPLLPGNVAIPSQYRGAAFIMDVSTLKKTVKISAPTASITGRATSTNYNLNAGAGPEFSLLGADVIDITMSNYIAGAVGATAPCKVLITFDLTLHNKLDGIRLITPTFPLPPAGVTGVQAFPFEISVVTSSGGVGTVGNEILVTSPRFGAAIPSNHWDGAPHSFFNDAACTADSNDCFRYEPFGSVGPLSASEARRVGFLVDPTVGDLRVKLIVAANVQATFPR